jgi:hypothetical protein
MDFAWKRGTMNMMKRILFIMIFSVSLFGGACGMGFAAEGSPSTHEEALLALINQARQNPLAVAASMGMDTEKILKDLPQLETILKGGLPAVTFNGNLYETARAHTQDMLANGYYSHDSPDGRGYDARIRNNGYPAVATGESLGMLVFANFLDPGDAIERLFEYMFRDELDPLRTEKRNILDSQMTEVAVSIDTGIISLGGGLWNVYVTTCDFGTVMSEPEAKLFNLINQARKSPLVMAASLGMDPDKILADFPEWHDLLTQGFSPLTFSYSLFTAAKSHAADMLAKGYFSDTSLDGRTFENRIRETGYNLMSAGESVGIRCLGTCLADETAEINDRINESALIIFQKLFTRELQPSYTQPRNILNAGLKDAGISLVAGTSSNLGGICGDCVLLMVADFGLRSEQQAP